MRLSKKENVAFCLWFFGLVIMIGIGASVAVRYQWGAFFAIWLPLAYAWASTFLAKWTDEGPFSARMFLGLILGSLTILWAMIGLTCGFSS